MTIRELIELLTQAPDQNMRVVIDGYEGGYHDLEAGNIGHLQLKLNQNTEWYYGPHDYAREDEIADEIAFHLGKSVSNMPLVELLKVY